MNGKCYSLCDQGQRNKADYYQTPYSMTQQLLEAEKFEGDIFEPASGKGAIIKVLQKEYNVTGDDLNNGYNFLTENKRFDNIITNPPYSKFFEFIQKAKELYNKKIAMLLPLNYLHGKKRYENGIYSELQYVYVFTRYPLLTDEIREDGKYKTGMMVYAWCVWSKIWKGIPGIKWIDNNKHVLKGNE